MLATPWALSAALLVLGAGSHACAQIGPAQMQPPAQTGSRETVLTADLIALHETNVSHSSASVAALRHLVQDEWIYEPQLSALVARGFGRQFVFLDARAGYDFHAENRILNRGRLNGTLGAIVPLGVCRLTPMGTYTFGQSELTDVAANVVTNDQTNRSGSLSVSCGRPNGLFSESSVQYSDTFNTADLQKFADHHGATGSLIFGYRNPSFGSLGIVTNVSRQTYDNRPTAPGGVGDAYSILTLGATYQKSFGERLKASLTLGESALKRDSAPVGVPTRFNSATFDGQATYVVGRRIEALVHVSHAVLPSNVPGKLYNVVAQYEANVTYHLGTRLAATLGVSESDNKANGDTTTSLNVLTSSQLRGGFLSILFKLGPASILRLEQRVETRNADPSIFNYRDNKTTITLHRSF